MASIAKAAFFKSSSLDCGGSGFAGPRQNYQSVRWPFQADDCSEHLQQGKGGICIEFIGVTR